MSRNERFKDVIYTVEIYLPINKSWHRMSTNYNDLESAQCAVHEHEMSDMHCYGKKMDYRIMKLTIKKEVIG